VQIAIPIIIGVLALIAIAAAQICTPPQWEGLEVNYDIQREFRGLFNISYDATNQRVRIYAETVIENTPSRVETIALFASKTIYEIDHVANRCRKIAINAPFERDCLPTNTTAEFKATLGITLPVTVYRISFGEGTNVVRGQAVLTSAANVPVQYLTYSARDGLDHSEFFDVTTGIRNPAVFTPPAICNAAASIDVVSNKLELRGVLRR